MPGSVPPTFVGTTSATRHTRMNSGVSLWHTHTVRNRLEGPLIVAATAAVALLAGCGSSDSQSDTSSPSVSVGQEQVSEVTATVDATSLTASWSPPENADAALEYRAFAFDAEQAPAGQCNAAPPQTTCTMEDLVSGTYTVAVRVLTDEGLGPISQPSEPVELTAP